MESPLNRPSRWRLPCRRWADDSCHAAARRALTRRRAGDRRFRLQLYLWIALGSALGGVARFWCTGVMARLLGETFPWGTLLVNVLGSLIIGFFATMTAPDGRMFVDQTMRQFVMIGFLGGYTTFSSFSLQTLNLANDGEWLCAGLYIGASVIVCLLAVWLGHILALSLNAMKWV